MKQVEKNNINIYTLWSSPEVPDEFKSKMQMEGSAIIFFFMISLVLVFTKNNLFAKITTIIMFLLMIDFVRFYYYSTSKSWIHIEGVCTYIKRSNLPFTKIKNPFVIAYDVVIESNDGESYFYKIRGKTKCKLKSKVSLYVSKSAIETKDDNKTIQGVIMAEYKDTKHTHDIRESM